ncbi:MAG TPA: hypothetical protein VI933_04445 [archaeon]|nr:hypothetical protein [archaeon]
MAGRTPIVEAEEGFDGNDGDPHAPVGLPAYGSSGGIGDYSAGNGGTDVYNEI